MIVVVITEINIIFLVSFFPFYYCYKFNRKPQSFADKCILQIKV